MVVGDLQALPVDARDVMILSVTYATHETSKRLQTDYRQLAELDGENFLTDAITRARMGLYVVASFHDVALDAGRQAMLGPKILDALLGYTQGIALAEHLHHRGYEWVVFTATRELIGIFARLGLPLPVVAPADPARLGDGASAWGSYYDTGPIVVAGRIRLAVERFARAAR